MARLMDFAIERRLGVIALMGKAKAKRPLEAALVSQHSTPNTICIVHLRLAELHP